MLLHTMPPRRKASKKKSTVKKRVVRSSAKKKISRHIVLVRTLRRAALARAQREKKARIARPHQLERHEKNPILEPREGKFWEMKATFNPGALYADRRVHLLYRAIGGNDVSVLGYAASDDGVNIVERSERPAYVPSTTRKPAPGGPVVLPQYCSGGGWNGGCEDPRLTLIDKTVYLMYTAFDGWGSIRIALTSAKLGDFLQKKWNWRKPALISPPGEIHKNWVLFPEKINGKFAILHSMSPVIEIEYLDDLEFRNEAFVRSREYHRANIPVHGGWERSIRGPGPTPIKTKDGWLVFYHGTTYDYGYKIGAMLLDLDDPTKIIARAANAILEPSEWYEKEGLKGNIVYSCGAVIKDGELFVYYGGADSVSCVAMANLDSFLRELKQYGTPKLAVEPKKNARNAIR
jgi:predicted GH43/DUF377 family glycosyl hydrolase